MGRHNKKTCVCIFILLIFFTSADGEVWGEKDLSPEIRIRAVIFKRFVKYTNWPGGAFSGDSGPIVLCVMKKSRFDEAFSAIKNKRVKGRNMVLSTCGHNKVGKGRCHIIFINSRDRKWVKKELKKFENKDYRGVLTVGMIKGFAKMGGMIGFYREGSKLQLEVNPDAARKKGISFKSDLLKLSTIIRENSQ